MGNTQILTRGDIVYVMAKEKISEHHETEGSYAVIVSGHHQSKQRYADIMYIDNSRQCCAKAYPVIWHLGVEATVQCNTERIDVRQIVYVDGHCTRKEMARINAVINGRHNLYAG